MRKVMYEINGVKVLTYAEKIALEQKFHDVAKVVLSDVAKNRAEPSALAQKMIAKFGYASPKFAGLV